MLLRRRGLGTTRKSVMRWERGVVPDSAAQRAIAEVFEITEDARRRAPWPNWLPSDQAPGIRQPWDGAGTIDALVRQPHLAS